MDEVIANFSLAFAVRYIKKFPKRQVVPWQERKKWKIRDDYPEKFRADIDAIYDEARFYLTLDLIKGAKTAIIALYKKYKIFFVTSLRKQNHTCYEDKVWWIETHIGPNFSQLMIPCSDKTLIWGHILIDDNPHPRKDGLNPNPSWTHVVFDQPWNRDIKSPRINTNWNNAEEVIERVLRDREKREILKYKGLGEYDEEIVANILGCK